MIKTSKTRSDRIELRTRPEIKAVIERAAQLRHATLSAYLIESGLQQAQSDLLKSETLVLHEGDRDLFYSLINSPPEPNEALLSLFKDRNS